MYFCKIKSSEDMSMFLDNFSLSQVFNGKEKYNEEI
jgi:hypothetical protein